MKILMTYTKTLDLTISKDIFIIIEVHFVVQYICNFFQENFFQETNRKSRNISQQPFHIRPCLVKSRYVLYNKTIKSI